MTHELQLGYQAGLETLQNKQHFGPLLNAAWPTSKTQQGADTVSGLLGVVCIALDACQRAGVSFAFTNERALHISQATPSTRRILLNAVLSEDLTVITGALSEICSALYSVRDRVTVNTTAPVNAAAAPAEPKEPPLMRVQIVGMPARTSEAEVERVGGAIVGTRTTEHDA